MATQPNYTITKANHEAERDPRWPAYRQHWLTTHGECAVCKSKKDLQVHHIYPVSYIKAVGWDNLELNFKNYVTLCETEAGHQGENHHLLIGHLDSFKSRNEKVKADIARFKNHPNNEATIKADAAWKQEMKNRPNPAEQMTDDEKTELIAELKRVFTKNEISPLAS